MKNLSILFALIVIGLSAQVGSAQWEKELVINTARALQSTPLSKDTRAMSSKALRWVIETDQVNVIVCGAVFEPFVDKKNKNGSEMTAAYTIGMAAFKLENPEKVNDENAAQLAGLETAMKVYEAIVAEKPKTKFDRIEALLTKRNNGELAAFVAAADCGKK